MILPLFSHMLWLDLINKTGRDFSLHRSAFILIHACIFCQQYIFCKRIKSISVNSTAASNPFITVQWPAVRCPPPDFMLFFYAYFRILTKQQHAAKSTFLVKLGFFNFDYFNLSKKILVFKGFFASSWIKFNSYFCFFRSCFSYHMPMEIQSNFLAK